MTPAAAAQASCQKFRPLLAVARRLVDEGRQDEPEAARMLEMVTRAADDLARICLDAGLVDDARGIAEARLGFGGDGLSSHLVLAEIDRRSGNIESSARHLAEAIRIEPHHAGHRLSFGRMALALGWQKAATSAFEAALAVEPDNAEAANHLTFQALADGDVARARVLAAQVLARDPANRLGLVNAAQAALGNGEIEEARGLLDQLLAIHPSDPEGHLLLSRLKTYQKDDPQIAAMQTAWGSGGQSAASRSRLGFALFKALDDVGEHQAAFPVLAEANRLRRDSFGAYDVADSIAFIDAMIAAFTPERIAELSSAGIAEERPVFILGLPRSGTTLAEQILSGHSEVSACGELDWMSHLVIAHAMQPDRRNLAPLDGDEGRSRIAAMAAAYREWAEPRKAGRSRITDKMPINFLWIGFIAMMFPDAAIIHMNRDPLANAFALYSTTFDNQAMEWAYDLDDLARFMVAHHRLMDHWRTVFPGRILDVSYEALTEDVEGHARMMLAFCGLDYEPGCLAFHARKRTVMTMSAAQVVKPVYNGRDRRTQPYRPHLALLMARLSGGSG